MDSPLASLFSKLYPGGSGEQIFFGVLKRSVSPDRVPSEEERARRRATAAASLTNIDDDERERRRLAGGVMTALTLALAIGLLATDAAPLSRAAIAPPLFLSYGYLASARTGL